MSCRAQSDLIELEPQHARLVAGGQGRGTVTFMWTVDGRMAMDHRFTFCKTVTDEIWEDKL